MDEEQDDDPPLNVLRKFGEPGGSGKDFAD